MPTLSITDRLNAGTPLLMDGGTGSELAPPRRERPRRYHRRDRPAGMVRNRQHRVRRRGPGSASRLPPRRRGDDHQQQLLDHTLPPRHDRPRGQVGGVRPRRHAPTPSRPATPRTPALTSPPASPHPGPTRPAPTRPRSAMSTASSTPITLSCAPKRARTSSCRSTSATSTTASPRSMPAPRPACPCGSASATSTPKTARCSTARASPTSPPR